MSEFFSVFRQRFSIKSIYHFCRFVGISVVILSGFQGWAQDSSRLPLSRLFESPPLEGLALTQVQFSPDQKYVVYLKKDEQPPHHLQLWGVDLDPMSSPRLLLTVRDLTSDTKQELSEEEKSRLEISERNSR